MTCEAAVGGLRHLGLVVHVEADEDDPFLPGLFVEVFPQTIGAEVPVEDVDVHVRVDLFEPDGAFHRMGAADPAAVGPLRFPGAHALDEGGALGPGDQGIFLPEGLVHFQGQQDQGILFIEILLGLVGVAADGDDRGAVRHHGFPALGGDGGVEIAHKPLDVGDFGVEVDLDQGMAGHPLHQVVHIGLHRLPFPGMVELQGVAAQEVLFLHQVHLIALVRPGPGPPPCRRRRRR